MDEIVVSQERYEAVRPLRLLMCGGGGHGKVVADVIRACGHELVGVVELDASRRGEVVEPGGARVVMGQDELMARLASGAAIEADAAVVAIGHNAARLRLCDALSAASVLAPALVHPRAWISPSARLGGGVVVCAGVVVNAGARVARGGILNTACVVEHDCLVAEGVHLSPNATLCGGVSVGARSWIGAASVVIQGVRVGADVVVGAGATVIREVEDGLTVAGCPARPISSGDRG